ncbi:MAG: 50S ribosomal protein L2 [Candidatus Omnitrophica bacterium]|nr:50S ribosomal protein L2 [Candidatus Omnitrophota bacterium]
MAIKKYKPVTPALRWTITSGFDGLTKKKREKSLCTDLRKSGGRNSLGRITVRHRGGGRKRQYRIIDFKRDKRDMPAIVIAIEYDPNRSARIALLKYEDGEKRYIIAPTGLVEGNQVLASENPNTEIKIGNCLSLKLIPPGTPIHNIELRRGLGGIIVRSAGSSAVITAKEGKFAQVKLPSGELRLVGLDCMATIGNVSNSEHSSLMYGKAGRRRWLGIRPSVRGVAMNPIDHPHGGGEGKAGQGNPHPVTPWGKPTKGFKTRKKTKYSDKFIIKRIN